MRHAAHVQQLELELRLHDGAPEAERHEVAALITGCVSACGASGQLRELKLSSGYAPLLPLSWLPALRSLRRLKLFFKR